MSFVKPTFYTTVHSRTQQRAWKSLPDFGINLPSKTGTKLAFKYAVSVWGVFFTTADTIMEIVSRLYSVKLPVLLCGSFRCLYCTFMRWNHSLLVSQSVFKNLYFLLFSSLLTPSRTCFFSPYVIHQKTHVQIIVFTVNKTIQAFQMFLVSIQVV